MIANPAAVDGTPVDYLRAAWPQIDAFVSPDGRWAAFTSGETGTPEVYVRRFPTADAGGILKVSAGGGHRARWSGDGTTVYYQALDGRTIRRARVTLGVSMRAGPSETVITADNLGSAWDVDWNTGKIYVTQAVGGEAARIVVMQNWLDNFRRTAPTP